MRVVDKYLERDVEMFQSRTYLGFRFLNLLFNLISFNLQLILKTRSIKKIMIYNDMSIVIATFPVLKIISWFRDIGVYYVFDSKWFSVLGDLLKYPWRFALNSQIYKKILIFDSLLSVYLKEKGVRDEGKFVMISAGVDLDTFKYKEKARFDKRLIYVGNIHTRRKLGVMVDAMKIVVKRYSKTKLVVVGAGNDLKNLKKKVKEAKLNKNFIFTGELSQEKVARELINSDICLSQYPPEDYDIQFPIKIFEYQAAGRPVITTDTTATRKYLKNKHDALMTKFDSKELALAIEELFSNRRLREKISKNGLKIAKRFGWEDIVARIRKIVFGGNQNEN